MQNIGEEERAIMEEKYFQHIKEMIGSFKDEIKNDFRLQAGILSADFQHKLQLVAEGHQMLAEKMDRMNEDLGGKIDAVATDLAAHRADTEGHKRGYMVHPVRNRTCRSLRLIAC